jgi:hypothetical protein
MLEIKKLNESIKNTVGSIISRQDQTGERISGMGNRTDEIWYLKAINKTLITIYNNFQELWDMIKRPNVRLHEVKEGPEI